MQKLRRINKEKDFEDGPRKRKYSEINYRQSQITPLSHLCGLVCGFRRRSKEAPHSHTSPCLGRFCGVFEKAEFLRLV